MKNPNKFIDECRSELKLLGISHGKIRNVTVNTRAKCHWGECRKVSANIFDISISALLLDDNADIGPLKNTVMHELLHTVPGCFKHTGKWKALANLINEKLPEYNIARTMSADDAGIKHISKEPVYRYILQCQNCSALIKRQRKSKVITNYKNYRCSKCGGILIPVDETRTDLI